MKDTIYRQAAIDEWKNDFKGYVNALNIPRDDYNGIMEYIDELPSAQPEQFTDKEKRIFLAAMTREELICLQIDEKHNDPNLVNLVEICHEITRKIKGALWT